MFDVFQVAFEKDPALRKGLSGLEVILYPGVQVILLYRISHVLHKLGVPFIPRAISYLGRFLTGAEIHPGAKIGKRFFIDHATGVVIGETAEIGNDVMLFQNVTLGGHGWWRDKKGEKRHPTLEDNVVVGVGAAILGPVTVKKNSRVGALSVIIDDIPENSTVVCTKGRIKVTEGAFVRYKDPCEHCEKECEWHI
ncbi:MAG: serine O-acetyltransferase EpsC [Candidatus Altiarchaeota archaeon]